MSNGILCRPSTSYFNPRTHTGCDTKELERELMVLGISIHAPTRGATYKYTYIAKVREVFQSTHPHGVRLLSFLDYLKPNSISIHAPTRGATRNVRIPSPVLAGFQSTHPHGVRRSSLSGSFIDIMISIHAPTRGAT